MPRPEKLLVFGDSLSDSGLAYALSAAVLKVPVPPASAGYDGWFSNGLIQTEVAAGLLGTALDNYAVGGARAVGSRTVAQYLAENGYDDPEIMRPDPDAQALATDTYLGGQLAALSRHAVPSDPPDEGTVASIWIGANDYNALPPDASPELVEQTIAAVVGTTIAAAGAVAATGVERIMIANLPAPDFLPLTLPPAFAAVVAAHNAVLAQGVALLQSQGVQAEIVDMNRMAAEITADPRTFGLDPAWLDQPLLLGIGSQPTWVEAAQDWVIPPNPAVAGVDPDRVAFTDFLHPSSATHGILGSFAAGNVTDNLVLLDGGDDRVHTFRLDDLVLAGAGSDRVFTDGGADVVFAGLGDDFVWAGDGRDIVAGGAGADTVAGGAGNDVVAGSDGDDWQFGGDGRDLLIDGLGFDRLHAGDANDALLYTEAAFLGGTTATDGGRFHGGHGRDTLYLALDDETRAAVEAELVAGSAQTLATIGVTTRSIERYVFVDPDDPATGIVTGALLAAADLWGLV